MLKDLKEFLLRGNVVDLAVGVIIASAFGAIVTSLVNDIITPLILNPALEAAKVQNIAELAWNGVTYGKFLSAIINFLVVGTVLFFVIKAMEKAQNLRKKEEVVEEAPAAPTELEVLQEIKALLEKNKTNKGSSLKLNPFFFTLLVTSQPFLAFS
ncbi:large conductance mechanosensitive channel protein MscL [Streptococcus oralis subsp. tigurinus]|nr:large conductance mechanosensitive channel protein MscL [Streptococcus oralis]KJQ76971.1 large conductance mechanosensitive channel protein MscL [Streptococcus oralis subsp. tigurinus]